MFVVVILVIVVVVGMFLVTVLLMFAYITFHSYARAVRVARLMSADDLKPRHNRHISNETLISIDTAICL